MIEERVSGSVAFSTISFGHFCTTVSLLALNNFFYRDKNKKETRYGQYHHQWNNGQVGVQQHGNTRHQSKYGEHPESTPFIY